MNKGSHLTKYSLIAILLAFAILGAFVAFVTYYYYEIMVRGILGFVTLYLLLNNSTLFRGDGSVKALLLRSNNIRDFISTFISTLIFCWAATQIVEMILYILKNR
jgi:hypothetical protein